MRKPVFILLLVLSLQGCMSILDQYPKTGPSNETFFSSEDELTLAVNACYQNLYWMSNQDVQWQLMLDGITEMVYIRGTYGNMNIIQAGQANAQTSFFGSAWKHFYATIARANNLLDHMERAKDSVKEDTYNQVRAQALALRAYAYHYLVFLYGDVPFADHFLSWDDCTLPKTRKETIIEALYDDLDFAAKYLPDTWGDADNGRVNRSFALGLKARIALYNGDYSIAADAAGEVIRSGACSIDPDYEGLFLHRGKNSKEIILSVHYLTNIQINANAKYIGTRLSNGYSVIVPLQTLVDTYQCTDGKRIDQSPLYDPMRPYENRDPRLRQSIIVPGDWHNGYKFEIHPDSLKTDAIINGERKRISNTEVTHAYGTFTGYVFRKYFDPADLPEFISKSELPVILMRYAEVLLTYAEAKIELGEIDSSVADAINAVRCRASVNMPAVSASDGKEALRNTVRYERSVEFCMEGLRVFDIRRWKIAEYVLPGKLLGRRTKADWYKPVVPSFNAYGKPVYPDEDIFNSLGNITFDPATGYSWPIPQDEVDRNPLLAEPAI